MFRINLQVGGEVATRNPFPNAAKHGADKAHRDQKQNDLKTAHRIDFFLQMCAYFNAFDRDCMHTRKLACAYDAIMCASDANMRMCKQ